jgi:hypothetical protein
VVVSMPLWSGDGSHGLRISRHPTCGNGRVCEQHDNRAFFEHRDELVKVRNHALTCMRATSGFRAPTSLLALEHDIDEATRCTLPAHPHLIPVPGGLRTTPAVAMVGCTISEVPPYGLIPGCLPEQLVHHLGALEQDRPEFLPVDDLRRPRTGVTSQPRDLLHRHSRRRQHAHEAGP